MLKRTMSLMLVFILTMTSVVGIASASTATKETIINLSDTAVTVDGQKASTSSSAAVENGLVIRDGKGNLMPKANLTAEQMKLIITRYVEWSGSNISVNDHFPNTLTGTMTRTDLATLLSKLL